MKNLKYQIYDSLGTLWFNDEGSVGGDELLNYINDLEERNKRIQLKLDEILSYIPEVGESNYGKAIKEVKELKFEIEVLRKFGNKDCTVMADNYISNNKRYLDE